MVIVSTLAGLVLLVFGAGLSDTATALTAVGAVGGSNGVRDDRLRRLWWLRCRASPENYYSVI